MLTGDENIADMNFRVIGRSTRPRPETSPSTSGAARDVKAVAESAMREIVGRTQIQRILTADRG